MSTLPFTKMQGLGNDFIVVDDVSKSNAPVSPLTPELARKLCNRRLGIGADQILWLRPAHGTADVRMEILNADGSVAEMCGNGIRAAALYLHRRGLKCERIETLDGVKTVQLRGEHVVVDMGVPTLGGGFPKDGEQLQVNSQELRFFEVRMGVPHAVFFVNRIADYPVEKLGPMIEVHPRFPKRTNADFVEVVGQHTLKMRVWERGAGLTLACGTGACASAVAAIALGKAASPVTVELPGGMLKIEWFGPGQNVMMEGGAQEVFSGEYNICRCVL